MKKSINIILKTWKEVFKENSPRRKCNILTDFDDLIPDIVSNKKKMIPVTTELFIRRTKLIISTVFIT